jgi:hypothetical protein
VGAVPVPITGTKKLNFTGTGTKRKILAGPELGPKKKLPGPGPGPNKKSYRDLDRDQKKLVPHIFRWDRLTKSAELVETGISPIESFEEHSLLTLFLSIKTIMSHFFLVEFIKSAQTHAILNYLF